MEQRPTVYVFHGDDSLAIERALHGMLAKMGDPSIAELNVSRLDGRENSEDTVRNAANSMPFLAERRLVILTHPFARLKPAQARERFTRLFDGLPETTALVLVIEDAVERGDWLSLRRDHWLRAWISAAGGRGHYTLCQLPSPAGMVTWVREEARRLGGQFSLEAAAALVAHIGNDKRTAGLEIEKLLLYVDRQRPVEAQEVEELTAQGSQADVFQMVDAMSAGNASLALNLLHRLMEEEDEINLFGMVVRQFRLLLVGREMIDEGRGTAEFAGGLARSEFVARKTMEQARRFSLQRLEEIYHRLLAIDEGVKTGKTSFAVALDSLVAELAR